MKYWRLFNSIEKEVGFVPQITEPVFKGNYNDPKQLWNLYFRKTDEINTIIPHGRLHKKAKVTDLMSVAFLSGDLFISKKLYDILSEFKVSGVELKKSATILSTGSSLETYIIHPFISDYRFIDVEKTEFYFTNDMGNQYLEKRIYNSIDEYLEACYAKINSNYKSPFYDKRPIKITQINFVENSELDLISVFGINYGGVGYFVSERLKQKILDEKCSGIIFKDINERYP